MSLVHIRVDLPAYSRSFNVHLLPSNTILDVKEEITRVCPGQPRPDGQRLIWRGRVLSDAETIESIWKSDTELRTVHLAVHPSAWSSKPPEIPRPASSSPPSVNYQTNPTSMPNPPTTNRTNSGYLAQSASPPPSELAFIHNIHQRALATLCPAVAMPTDLDNVEGYRSLAFGALETNGWSWRTILDEPFPESSPGGLLYEAVTLDNHFYIRLVPSSAQPTPIQLHALKVLSFTFTILALPLSPTPTRQQPTQTQSVEVPPHINQMLQQMGFAPLRVAPNGNPIPAANQNAAEIRQIPIRPLLAPLVMLMLRTVLLLYFVAPARKPVIGILILAWMLYEIWLPIRNAMRNAANLPAQERQRNNNVANGGQANAQGEQARPAGEQININVPRPQMRRPPTIEGQAGAVFDTLANMNLAEEERLLNLTDTALPEPGLGHKFLTFVGLLFTTMHPAVWNRRRVALRRREGTIRTEANIRNSEPEQSTQEAGNTNEAQDRRTQIREQLIAEHNRRPGWMQRYIQRVEVEDWVDDAD